MRMSDLGFTGLEFFPSVRQFVAGCDDFLGSESSESISCFAQGCGVALFPEPIRLQIFKEKSEASYYRIHLAADPVLTVDLCAEPLLGANDTVSALILLLSEP